MDESLDPCLTLLKDWISSSGNTRLSVEMLCACLEETGRKDVVEIIIEEEGKDILIINIEYYT